MSYITSTLSNLLEQTAFFNLTWGNYVMIVVALIFLYLAIKHDFEPLLLIPIAFGMLLVNIYPDIMAEPYVDALAWNMRADCCTISMCWMNGVFSRP